MYNTPEKHAYARAKKYRHELRRQEREHAREKKQQKPKPGWAASLVMMPEDVDDDAGPSDDSSDSGSNSSGDADTNGADRKRMTSSRNTVPLPPSDWDPALKVCYNCASVGHHWGDDCFLRRTNPTRPTGDPSPFSEVIANAGPYSQAYAVRDGSVRSRAPDLTIPPPPRRKRSRHSFSGRTSSLLEDLQNSGSTNKDDDDDDDDDDVVQVDEDNVGSENEEDDDDEDAFEDLTWEDVFGGGNKPQTTSQNKPSAKAPSATFDEMESDEEKPRPKEKRMTTSKRKAENYYTHANVKNRNRQKKASLDEIQAQSRQRERGSRVGVNKKASRTSNPKLKKRK